MDSISLDVRRVNVLCWYSAGIGLTTTCDLSLTNPERLPGLKRLERAFVSSSRRYLRQLPNYQLTSAYTFDVMAFSNIGGQ